MRNNSLILCITLALFIQSGCAHTTGPIISDSLQETIHHIGVVVERGQEDTLGDTRRGWLSSIGKGAGYGSYLGGLGVFCYWGVIVCAPVLAAAGAVGGSVYGAFQAGSEALSSDTERMLVQAITEVELPNLLEHALVATANTWGYPMDVISHAPAATEQPQLATGLRQERVDIILKLNGPVVNLLPASYEMSPPRRVALSMRVRVIRTADQTVLDDRIVVDDSGVVYSLEGWTQDQARRLRDELPQATQRLVEKTLIDYFAKFEFKEQSREFALFGPGHGYGYRLRGLTSPSQIKPGPSPIPVHVDSLRPTLQWEQFLGNGVTYDLKLWESTQSGERELPGVVIYQRDGLIGNRHTLEIPLVRASTYHWSVRVRFIENGKARVSDWTMYKLGITTTMKIITLGMFVLVEPLLELDWGYYLIRTPYQIPTP